MVEERDGRRRLRSGGARGRHGAGRRANVLRTWLANRRRPARPRPARRPPVRTALDSVFSARRAATSAAARRSARAHAGRGRYRRATGRCCSAAVLPGLRRRDPYAPAQRRSRARSELAERDGARLRRAGRRRHRRPPEGHAHPGRSAEPAESRLRGRGDRDRRLVATWSPRCGEAEVPYGRRLKVAARPSGVVEEAWTDRYDCCTWARRFGEIAAALTRPAAGLLDGRRLLPRTSRAYAGPSLGRHAGRGPSPGTHARRGEFWMAGVRRRVLLPNGSADDRLGGALGIPVEQRIAPGIAASTWRASRRAACDRARPGAHQTSLTRPLDAREGRRPARRRVLEAHRLRPAL